jgi:hypothetical protein
LTGPTLFSTTSPGWFPSPLSKNVDIPYTSYFTEVLHLLVELT